MISGMAASGAIEADAAAGEIFGEVAATPERAAEPIWTENAGAWSLRWRGSWDLLWAVRVHVRLGGKVWEGWVSPQVSADEASGDLVYTLALPAEAWLDPLAADYVADVAVQVIGSDLSGAAELSVNAPPLYAAWPNGAGSAPVVWDAAGLALAAPNGIVSAAARAGYGDLGDTRVQAPIAAPPRPDVPVVEVRGDDTALTVQED